MTSKKNEIIFSIIIPTYNSSNFISNCLNSIIKFDYNFKYEILIVDDSSSDKTWSIVKNFSKKFNQIKIFKTIKNSGPGVCRNLGIRNSLGKYLIFLDSDDLIVKGSLENLYEIIRRNIDIQFIINNTLRSKPPYNNNYFFETFKKNRIHIEEFLNKCLMKNIHVDEVWKLVVKTSFLKKNKIYFPNIYIGEDQCFILKLFKVANLLYLNRNSHIYHNHTSTGLSQNIGNFVCISYSLVKNYLISLKSKNKTYNNYIKFKVNSIKVLSYLNFILLTKKDKYKVINSFKYKKLNSKSYISEVNNFKKNIILNIKKYNFNKKSNFFIYCADIYGLSFFEIINKQFKIKHFIDDNKELNYKYTKKFNVKSFVKTDKKNKNPYVFFVCIKDLNKFKKIKAKIKSSKLLNPIIIKVDF